jgi:hypothetical protein
VINNITSVYVLETGKIALPEESAILIVNPEAAEAYPGSFKKEYKSICCQKKLFFLVSSSY